MIYGPKEDGTYVVEFKTAAGEALAISSAWRSTAPAASRPGARTRPVFAQADIFLREAAPYGLVEPIRAVLERADEFGPTDSGPIRKGSTHAIRISWDGREARLISGSTMRPLTDGPRHPHPSPHRIIRLAADGLLTQEIAVRLGVSPRSVERYGQRPPQGSTHRDRPMRARL